MTTDAIMNAAIRAEAEAHATGFEVPANERAAHIEARETLTRSNIAHAVRTGENAHLAYLQRFIAAAEFAAPDFETSHVLAVARDLEGAEFEAAGFEIFHTGGGCTAWRRDVTESHYIMITCLDGAGHTLSGPDDHWLVGLHWDDGEGYSDCVDAETVADALEAAERFRLASTFARFLADDIGPENLAEVIRRNDPIDPATCASHDFCDANVTMLNAWQDVFGEETDFDSDDQLERFNRAWDLAKANKFFTESA